MNHWTIQLLIDCDIVLSARCGSQSCDSHQKLDLMQLKTELGPEASAMQKDLAPIIRCPKCDNEKVGLSYSPRAQRPTTRQGPDRYDPLHLLRQASAQ